jgi:hypothetical protein
LRSKRPLIDACRPIVSATGEPQARRSASAFPHGGGEADPTKFVGIIYISRFSSFSDECNKLFIFR